MSTTEQDEITTHGPDTPASAPASGSGSLLGRLRSQREAASKRTTTTYPVPTYKDPELVCVFRLLGEKEISTIGDRIMRQYDDDSDRALWSMIDAAIAACTGVYARELESDELIPIGLPDDPPIRIGKELAEALGFEASSAREAFIGLFGGPDHISEAFEWARGLNAWMGNTTVRLDREARLGET